MELDCDEVYDPDLKQVRARLNDRLEQLRITAALQLAKRAIDDWLGAEESLDHPSGCACSFCQDCAGILHYLRMAGGCLESSLNPPSWSQEWEWSLIRDYALEIAPPTVSEAAQATLAIARGAIGSRIAKYLPPAG